MLYGLILFGTAKNTEILSSVEGFYTLVLPSEHFVRTELV